MRGFFVSLSLSLSKRYYLLVFPMLMFALLLPLSCKAGNSTISPIMPDGTGSEPPQVSDEYTNSRTSSSTLATGQMRLIGPEEMVTSEMNPPLITESQPSFTVRISGLRSSPNPNDFILKIDNIDTKCDVRVVSDEISVSPVEPIRDGNHSFVLIFSNPEYPPRILYKNFRIVTKPSMINAVLWSFKDDYALVIFDSDIEPSRLRDASRWRFNNDTDNTRAQIKTIGCNQALLPLTQEAYSKERNKEPLTISFLDKLGTIDYVVRRGGDRDVETRCNCDGIDVTVLTDHRDLEQGAEKYAFAYQVTLSGPTPRCPAIMRWDNWTVINIGNDVPNDPLNCSTFDLSEDSKCNNGTDIGPMNFYMDLNTAGIRTFSFDRLHVHFVNISFWADCDQNPGNGYEVQIDDPISKVFGDSFDCQLPQFDFEPKVMYGDVGAAYIEGLIDGFTWADEIPDGDPYLIAYTEEYFNAVMQQDLLDHSCDLFVIAQAQDPISGNRHGRIDIAFDAKLSDGSCLFGDELSEPSIDLIYDFPSYAGLFEYPGGPGVHNSAPELIFNWPDPTYNDPEGGIHHDWCSNEGQISYLNLTHLLLGENGENITSVRARITDDNTQQPDAAYRGNWRRSGNVLDQVCLWGLRQGQRTGAGEGGCEYTVVPRFIDDNPYDALANHEPDPRWKIVKFDAEEINNPDRETTFIYAREANGSRLLNFFIMVKVPKTQLTLKPESIDVKFTSSEDKTTFKPGVGENTITVKATEIVELPAGITFERLYELFNVIPGVGGACNYYFYHTTLTISDALNTNASTKTLFVSSRDTKLLDNKIIDFTRSYSVKWFGFQTSSNFSFGTSRGKGTPNPTNQYGNKNWYSYDEFITNGGIEVITAEVDGADTDIKYKSVPVQSEADIILIEADGGYDGSPNETANNDWIAIDIFSYPSIYSNKSLKWENNASKFVVNDVLGLNCVGDDYCSDFSSDVGWQPFWSAVSEEPEDDELKWLALADCFTMTKTKVNDIRLNWKKVINDGFVSSVTGFTGEVKANRKFFEEYGDNLSELYNNVVHGYESSTEVCVQGHEDYYVGYNPNVPDSWKVNASKDLSVAAWMEAAASGFSDDPGWWESFANGQLYMAAAINDEVPHTDYYYFFLERVDGENISQEDYDLHKCPHKIKKESLISQ